MNDVISQRNGRCNLDSDFKSLELKLASSHLNNQVDIIHIVILMEKIKKILKIGKIYRIESQDRIDTRNIYRGNPRKTLNYQNKNESHRADVNDKIEFRSWFSQCFNSKGLISYESVL